MLTATRSLWPVNNPEQITGTAKLVGKRDGATLIDADKLGFHRARRIGARWIGVLRRARHPDLGIVPGTAAILSSRPPMHDRPDEAEDTAVYSVQILVIQFDHFNLLFPFHVTSPVPVRDSTIAAVLDTMINAPRWRCSVGNSAKMLHWQMWRRSRPDTDPPLTHRRAARSSRRQCLRKILSMRLNRSPAAEI